MEGKLLIVVKLFLEVFKEDFIYIESLKGYVFYIVGNF